MSNENPDFSDVSATVTSTEQIVEQTYTIQPGDSLSKIAKEKLGNANAWKKIFDANTDVIKDPDKIFPGQVIKIPTA